MKAETWETAVDRKLQRQVKRNIEKLPVPQIEGRSSQLLEVASIFTVVVTTDSDTVFESAAMAAACKGKTHAGRARLLGERNKRQDISRCPVLEETRELLGFSSLRETSGYAEKGKHWGGFHAMKNALRGIRHTIIG